MQPSARWWPSSDPGVTRKAKYRRNKQSGDAGRARGTAALRPLGEPLDVGGVRPNARWGKPTDRPPVGVDLPGHGHRVLARLGFGPGTTNDPAIRRPRG